MKLRVVAVILTATSFLAINSAFTGDCDIKHSKIISELEEHQDAIDDINSQLLRKHIEMITQEGN